MNRPRHCLRCHSLYVRGYDRICRVCWQQRLNLIPSRCGPPESSILLANALRGVMGKEA